VQILAPQEGNEDMTRPASFCAHALVLSAILAGPAQATVVFNWVQTGTVQPLANEYRSFSVAIADSVYLAAQAAPVTFGKIKTVVGSPDIPRLSVTVGSDDMLVKIFTADVAGLPDGLHDLNLALPICNSAPLSFGSCTPVFASTAVQPSGFANFFAWGGVGTFNVSNSYSFTLGSTGLAVSTTVGPANTGYITTNSSGVGEFGYGSDGETVVRGLGYWELDASTIPSPVPLPPSAYLMALGLAGVALRTRRNQARSKRA
jgi:hypothetical protein